MNQLTTDLRAARAYLVKYGWCQGTNKNANSNVCMDGAIIYSLGDSDENCARYATIYKFVDDVLAKKEGYDYNYVNWNDQAGRTQEEVLALFDHAIAASEQQS